MHPTLLDATPHEIFDGMEPDDWRAPLASPHARGLDLATLSANGIDRLAPTMEPKIFAEICERSGVVHTQSTFSSFVDARGLVVYYVIRLVGTHSRELIIGSVGEYQPARYRAWILSVWSC